MNVYICSTVRHLLFSLLKATNEKSTPSHILFFYDYQDVDPNSLQPDVLPSNISLSLVSRQSIRERLQSSRKGRILNFFAMRNTYTTEWIRKAFRKYLQQEFPELTHNWESSSSLQLFVFNERNKMSRLFRLLVTDYSMIEDGMANYYRIQCNKNKWPIRLLQGKPPTHKVFGESQRCKAIYVITPDATPQEIRRKTIKIDFIQNACDFEPINRFFGFQPLQESESSPFIIATQPTFYKEFAKSRLHHVIYREMINQITAYGTKVIFKTHPQENAEEYQELYPEVPLAQPKIPLELIALNSKSKVNIISITSSAGLGFEDYCHRTQLIEQDERTQAKDIMLSWDKHSDLLAQTIKKKIAPLMKH